MIILIDTREQRELKFHKSWVNIDGVERTTIKTGDYMVRFADGYVPPISIERKSKQDLYGTLTKGMKRFSKEINRAIESGLRFYLFIECSNSELEKPCTYKKGGKEFTVKVEPEQILRTLNTLEMKHGVIHKCFNNRTEMAKAIYRLFFSAGRLHLKRKKTSSKYNKNVQVMKDEMAYKG